METLLTAGFLISAFAVVPAFVAALLAERELSRHLKSHHPRLWADIAPVPGAEPSVSSPLARFITQRRYLALGDEQLIQLGNRARVRLYVAVSVFFAFVIFGLSYSVATKA